jgi:phenylpropionate dioxygenase-like ring-hydroxylating dioxygenase large terminal subunit
MEIDFGGPAQGRKMGLMASNIPDPQALAAAARVLAGSDRVADPFETAQIFPAEAYTGEDFWRFEKWALFEREWLCVGHVGQIPKPGDHFTLTIIGEPIIVARDEGGAVNVFSAICQHRGHPLMDGLDAPAAPGACRNAKRLICPYHAWSYRLDGRLHAAPGMDRTASAEELRERIRLPLIRHTVFHGLIFVNFDADASDLGPGLERMEAMIGGYGLEALCATPASSVGIASNWKIYQENSLEPYHTDTVHKTSHNPAPANLSAFYDYAPGDGAIITTTGFAESAELFAADDQPGLPLIPGLDEAQNGRLLFIAMLPVLFLLFEPGSVLVTLALPQGAARMTLTTFSLYPQGAVESPDFQAVVQAQAKALRVIVDEDRVTQEALQRGHGSRFTPKGVLSWLEATIPQMNGWLVERYDAALRQARA